ncbi:MAG: hypothetical protein ACI4OJ_01920 [Lachnospiraceae bacterium]
MRTKRHAALGAAIALALGLSLSLSPVQAMAKEQAPDYSYVAKDVTAWKAVYGPLLSKYAPQTKTLPGQGEKEQDCAAAADQLYQLTADTKQEAYPGAYKLKKALMLFDVLQGNYTRNAVGLLLDHGYFTDYYSDLTNAHLLPDGYKLPAKSYTAETSDETVEVEDEYGTSQTEYLLVTNSPYLEAEQLLSVAIYSNDKTAAKEQREKIQSFEDDYVPKAKAQN